MVTCLICGERIKGGSKFCPGCGKPVDVEIDDSADENEKSRDIINLICGIIFIILVATGIIVF